MTTAPGKPAKPRTRRLAHYLSRGGLCSLALVLHALSAPGAQARTPYEKPDTLRVCQDPNNMPFSNAEHTGIENRIAEVFGRKLGIPVEFYSFPQRLAFVRNTIRYKLPGQDYRCDVMLGVPERFGQVSTTKAYYRSTYALVYRKGGKLDGITSADQLAAKAGQLLDPHRLGIHDKSPAAAWLSKHDLTALARTYPMMSPDPGAYPGQLIERDLAEGNIDAAILWGPIAGYYGAKVRDPELVVVPLISEPGVRFDFSMAMGVRYGEPEWKNEIQGLINSSQDEIAAILREFHVPLVNDIGDLIDTPDSSTASRPEAQAPSATTSPAQPGTDAALLKAERDAQASAAAAAAARTRAAAEQLSKQPIAAATAPVDDAASHAGPTPATSPAKPALHASAATGNLYQVQHGNQVDAATYEGFKTWRAAACDRCHGASQQGLVGPSLIESLKTLSHDDFVTTVRDGRLAKGMQSFGSSKRVMDNIDKLYAYLKGRSDGAITQAKVQLIQP